MASTEYQPMTVEIFIIVFLLASLHPFRDLLLKGLHLPDICYFSISLMWVIFAIQHALVVGAPLMISLDDLPSFSVLQLVCSFITTARFWL